MDISSTRHLGHRRLVRGSGEGDLGNLFASYFLRKDENPLSCSRSSKYDSGQEIRIGTPESSDVRSREVFKLHTREHRTGSGREGRGAFSNADHLWTLIEERRDRKKDRDTVYEYRLKGLISDLQGTNKRLLLRAKSTGA